MINDDPLRFSLSIVISQQFPSHGIHNRSIFHRGWCCSNSSRSGKPCFPLHGNTSASEKAAFYG